jgi:archaellum component FlaG (FlaF/FlaG flagellin family)
MRTPAKIAILVLAMTLVAVAASVATAITFSSTVTGKSVTQVKVVRSTLAQQFTDDGGATTATDLTGASTTVKVPAGQKALLLIRFSAATACYGGAGGGYDSCYVQVLVNGSAVAPGEVSFDNNNTNTESTQLEAHSMEWAKTVGAGTFTVQIKVRTDDSPCCVVYFDLNPWTLTVERVVR